MRGINDIRRIPMDWGATDGVMGKFATILGGMESGLMLISSGQLGNFDVEELRKKICPLGVQLVGLFADTKREKKIPYVFLKDKAGYKEMIAQVADLPKCLK